MLSRNGKVFAPVCSRLLLVLYRQSISKLYRFRLYVFEARQTLFVQYCEAACSAKYCLVMVLWCRSRRTNESAVHDSSEDESFIGNASDNPVFDRTVGPSNRDYGTLDRVTKHRL